jgi:RimJ/RimL family protein N-acetyltransferase
VPTPPVLTDGVVALRLAVPSDAEAMTAGLSDVGTVEWLISVPHPYDHQESVRWVEGEAANGWRDGTVLFLTIADAVDDRFLGEIGLTHLALEDGRAEVAYWLVPEERGRGAVRRALRLLLPWAFEELGIVRVDWGARAGNDASLAAAEAVGFRFEGVQRGAFLRRYDGARFDEWRAGLLREDFLAG